MASHRAARGAATRSLAAAAALLALAPAPATAQAELEEIVVTGSRIVRRDALSVGPLTTLTNEDIRNAAPLSVGQLLQDLPGAGVSLNSNGTQGTSFGVSAINLRNLGSVEGSGNRVLVLVDGHRWINAAGGRGFRDFVDLNTIPMGIVETIEVLKDGASAIYGADAIAGVVNVITRRDLEGFEAKAQAGITSRSDGRSMSGELTWGHGFGNGSVLLSASYVDSEEILTRDRALTRRATAPVTAPPTSPRGLYQLNGISTAATALTRIPGTAGTSAADFRVARLPDDDFNTLVQGNYSNGPSERLGLFGRITADLVDGIEFRSELLYNRRESAQLFSPFLLDVRGTNGFAIAADHPFNPFDRAFSGSAFRIQRVPEAVGDRNNIQTVETFRTTAGLEGELEWMGSWSWDAFFSYSKNDAVFRQFNQIDYDRLALGIGPGDRCAANSCVPVDLFGEITPAMADYIRYNSRDENGTGQYDATFNVSGMLFDLPAGEVGVAAGVEYRRESAYDRPDAGVNAAPRFVTGLARTSAPTREPTVGSYDLREGYAELAVPLLADLPLARSLDLSAAVRYSDYSTFGGATTTKLGLAYRPVDDVLLRGTFSEGFRAPSILELYQGGRETLFQGTDPCNGGGAGLPGCAGVPTGYNQNRFGNGLLRGSTGGNLDLDPETADTYSVGVALTPSWVEGLSLTSDWYRITVKDAIAAQSPQQILNNCARRGGDLCDLVTRDPATGEILNLRQVVQNFSRIQVEGLDTTLRYGLDTEWGRFTAVLDAARLIRFVNYVPQPDGTVLRDERTGRSDTPRSSYPRWKGQGSLRWSEGPWEAGWKVRYIGDMGDIPNNLVNGGRVGEVFMHDLQLGYTHEDSGVNLTLGVDNAFDKQPPVSAANNPINFDIYTYDVRGTYLYARIMVKM
ncbi:MAG TPA: TonB-dependent receptor [Azospirillaceae bacterium]|nr:TonB-dependent receptor [Azospirillaceae bacterium]